MPSNFESMNGDIKDPPPLGYMKGKLWRNIDTEIKFSDVYSMIEIGCDYPTNGYSGINCDVPPWKISLDIFWKVIGSKTCRVVQNTRPSPSQDGFLPSHVRKSLSNSTITRMGGWQYFQMKHM